MNATSFLEGSPFNVFNEVLRPIMGPKGKVWDWFPNARRTDDAGLPKNDSFMLSECRGEGGQNRYCPIGDNGDPTARMAILRAKMDAVSNAMPTSLMVRDLSLSPPRYGGGSWGNGWVHAGSGLPELLDHVLICRWQQEYNLITRVNYDSRTGLQYPGIMTLVTEAGISLEKYGLMKDEIDQLFIAAAAKFP